MAQTFDGHLKFYLNTLPVSILQKELSRATDGMECGGPLLNFVIKSDPDFIGSISGIKRKQFMQGEKRGYPIWMPPAT